MIHGLDTGFLVAAEIIEHAHHTHARGTLAQLVSSGDTVAVAHRYWPNSSTSLPTLAASRSRWT